MAKNTAKIKRGIVVSDKADKTIVVSVDRVKTHPIYKKQFAISKKYKADDPENSCKIGDEVEIISCRPISKDKKFRVLRSVSDRPSLDGRVE